MPVQIMGNHGKGPQKTDKGNNPQQRGTLQPFTSQFNFGTDQPISQCIAQRTLWDHCKSLCQLKKKRKKQWKSSTKFCNGPLYSMGLNSCHLTMIPILATWHQLLYILWSREHYQKRLTPCCLVRHTMLPGEANHVCSLLLVSECQLSVLQTGGDLYRVLSRNTIKSGTSWQGWLIYTDFTC